MQRAIKVPTLKRRQSFAHLLVLLLYATEPMDWIKDDWVLCEPHQLFLEYGVAEEEDLWVKGVGALAQHHLLHPHRDCNTQNMFHVKSANFINFKRYFAYFHKISKREIIHEYIRNIF